MDRTTFERLFIKSYLLRILGTKEELGVVLHLYTMTMMLSLGEGVAAQIYLLICMPRKLYVQVYG
jgi:hypothetical protein